LPFFSLLYSIEEETQEVDGAVANAFFQHILSKAFAVEFENEKNITRENRAKIAQVQADFEQLKDELKAILKESLGKEGAKINQALQNGDINALLPVIEKINSELELLKNSLEMMKKNSEDIKNLAERIAKLEGSKERIRESVKSGSEGIYYLNAPKALIYSTPTISSDAIGELSNGAEISFESCDKYGWCKLKGRDGFVARFLFLKR